ncbi:hypothetical protein AALO_G00229970 [Alosa alosa]|uniref:Uncharacterized protein n=1 Tax=Alosa alosa TaxID=278164 RepID=A0AAV6FYS3_9TELE|nr:hypothetical protein AALO_G00229970 [Alosa alosa]
MVYRGVFGYVRSTISLCANWQEVHSHVANSYYGPREVACPARTHAMGGCVGTQRRALGASRNGGRRNKKRGGERGAVREDAARVVSCCWAANYFRCGRGSYTRSLAGLRGFWEITRRD